MRNSRLDMWDGIAPPLDPVVSGDLLEGETYIVHGTTGSVTYRGGTYRSGATFRAGTDHAFQRHGDCQLYIYDGIRHAARKGGTTNEWVMLLETHCYHPSVSSIWKADAYSDYWAFNQRCLFYPWTAPLACWLGHEPGAPLLPPPQQAAQGSPPPANPATTDRAPQHPRPRTTGGRASSASSAGPISMPASTAARN
jgi:hypothetical protein